MGLRRRVVQEKTVPPFHVRNKWLIILCSLMGLHISAVSRMIPSKRWRVPFRTLTTIVHMFMVLTFCSSFIATVQLHGSIFHRIHAFLILSASVHGAMRQIYMHVTIKKFDKVYCAWDELFSSDEDCLERQKFIDRRYKVIVRNLFITNAIITISFTAFTSANYMNPSKIMRIPTAFPYRHQSPDYEFICTYYVIMILLHCIAVGSSQTLLFLPLVWELAELERLKLTLTKILKDAQSVSLVPYDGKQEPEIKASQYTPVGIDQVKRKMDLWIKQHIKLRQFHNYSTDATNFEFSLEIIFVFLAATIIAILVSSPYFNLLDKVTNFGSFLLYFVLFYILCTCCDEIQYLGSTLAQDAYAENWSALPLDLKKNLHTIMSMSMKPMKYTGVRIYNIDIMCFNQIFQTAWSVYNFCLFVVYGD